MISSLSKTTVAAFGAGSAAPLINTFGRRFLSTEEVPPSPELEACEKELATVKGELLRAIADQRNAVQRHREALDAARADGAIRVLKSVLEVADNLERAAAAVPPQVAKGKKVPAKAARQFVDGVTSTDRQMHALLEKNGVKKIESLGRLLDPHLHMGLSSMTVPGKEDGEIIAVIADGYTMGTKDGDKLLRAATVVVNKAE